MALKLTSEEQETHINMSADNRRVWYITSDDPVMVRKFKSIGARLVDVKSETHFFELPENQITLRKKRVVSAEQRTKLSERARAMRASMSKTEQGDVS